jgi:large subunit ribosomal protein L23
MQILEKPILTEKMNEQGEKLQRYGFIVAKSANKLQIKAAIEEMYGVGVKTVNTMVYGGKLKQRYTQAGLISGKAKAYKKAIITLEEGEQIDFYSSI